MKITTANNTRRRIFNNVFIGGEHSFQIVNSHDTTSPTSKKQQSICHIPSWILLPGQKNSLLYRSILDICFYKKIVCMHVWNSRLHRSQGSGRHSSREPGTTGIPRIRLGRTRTLEWAGRGSRKAIRTHHRSENADRRDPPQRHGRNRTHSMGHPWSSHNRECTPAHSIRWLCSSGSQRYHRELP